MKTTIKKKYLIFAAAALTLTACSSDDENMSVNDGPVAAQITAGVSGPATRANNNVWEADAIGVRVTETKYGVTEVTKDLYQNVEYTTASTGTEADFTSTDGILFQDASEKVTFAAYGPYQSSYDNETLPGNNGVITGNTSSQNTRELQKAFDYIYASGATASRSDPQVLFSGEHEFQHKMTKLILIVKTSANNGFSATDVTNGIYTLSGLTHTGQFDVTTGEALATGTASPEAWSLSANSLMTEGETQQRTFTSILYPQTLASPLVFTATIDNRDYTNGDQIKPELNAGNSYTYTITVKKTGLEISTCTIQDWTNGGEFNIDAEQ